MDDRPSRLMSLITLHSWCASVCFCLIGEEDLLHTGLLRLLQKAAVPGFPLSDLWLQVPPALQHRGPPYVCQLWPARVSHKSRSGTKKTWWFLIFVRKGYLSWKYISIFNRKVLFAKYLSHIALISCSCSAFFTFTHLHLFLVLDLQFIKKMTDTEHDE